MRAAAAACKVSIRVPGKARQIKRVTRFDSTLCHQIQNSFSIVVGYVMLVVIFLDNNNTISLVSSWTLPSQGQTDNYVMEEIGIGTAERERKEG